MWASGNILEADARKQAERETNGTKHTTISPAEIKRRLAQKKEEERERKTRAAKGKA